MKDASASTVRLADYRPPAYRVERVVLHVGLYEDHAIVRASLQLQRNGPEARPLELDGQALELLSLTLDGQPLPPSAYRLDARGLTLATVPAAFTLETVCRIYPQRNTSLEGLYRSRTLFCTQCEAEGFRKITFYPDRPDVLSLFDLTVEADVASCPVLLGNGNPVASGRNGDRHWARWLDPWPKPSYLFALVAGDLQFVEDHFVTAGGRRVQLRLYVEAKDLGKCAFAMDALKRAMRWDEEAYGREYDLDVFNIVAVDDFNMGAMENKGLNIFNTSAVLADPDVTTDAGYQRIEAIVAHEYFHNWSGNRVTCRDWFQLSLKEGFTVFRDSEFSAAMGSPSVKRIEDVALLRSVQFPEDSGPMAHPVQPDSYMEISNFYTPTVYEKGAEVVRMLRNLIGPEAFRRGSDLYFSRHDGQAVTIDAFLAAMSDASGRDLDQFRRWYSQSGTPRLQARAAYDAAAQRWTLTVEQSCPPTPGQPVKQPFHIPLAVGLVAEGGSLPLRLSGETMAAAQPTRVLDVTEPLQQFVFEGVPVSPVPSLLRDFSAPVRLSYPYSQDDLLFLARHDDNAFCRYEAGQQLMAAAIMEHSRGAPVPSAIEDLAGFLLAQPAADPAMQAMMLTLPAVSFLVDQAEQSDPAAIAAARDRIRTHLGQVHHDGFARAHAAACAEAGPYRVDGAAVAWRSLRQASLAYLVAGGSAEARSLAVAQYRTADNLTLRLSALNALLQAPEATAVAVAEPLLADFMQRWGHEPLAVNQWLQCQALSVHSDIARIEALMAHPAFELTNPNKVRAVIGAFCSGNPRHFHRADGAGYAFLAEQVLRLDAINPQVAARLLTPLTRWPKCVPGAAAGMVAALRTVAAAAVLSPDVQEVVNKSLAAAG